MKVLAAIVTHNRCQLLLRCIDHVLAQSRPPDHLVVINNGSTDNTEAELSGRQVHCITQDNVGSAGGWHRAITHGLDNGFDWIWLMDDDGYPEHKALELLTEQATADKACVSSVVIREDAPDRFVFPFPYLDQSGLPVMFRWPRKMAQVSKLKDVAPNGVYPFVHLFNGALINLEAVKVIGNINRDYFIYGDDVDYFCRLREYGPVLSILESLHFHPDVSSRPLDPFKIFYYLRNTFILHNKYFNHPKIRNFGAVLIALARIMARNGLGEAFSYVLGKNRRHLARAISFGRAGKLGQNFDG
jgi:rhamnopyranosyl-N-acetylglucosaminyl-diphospho-decaprenol beta-1,3/1,4-galactofuranosyltransferase